VAQRLPFGRQRHADGQAQLAVIGLGPGARREQPGQQAGRVAPVCPPARLQLRHAVHQPQAHDHGVPVALELLGQALEQFPERVGQRLTRRTAGDHLLDEKVVVAAEDDVLLVAVVPVERGCGDLGGGSDLLDSGRGVALLIEQAHGRALDRLPRPGLLQLT
jgi:hypothetical protein